MHPTITRRLFVFARHNDGDGTDTGDTGSDTGGGDADRTFTQADVDRIVQERVARVKNTPPADYDQLKAAAAELEQLRDAERSELERANGRAESAEQAAAAATDRANRALKRAGLVSAAVEAGAVDPATVADLLLASDQVNVSDDGDVTGAEEAVQALLESKPFLVGKNQPRTPSGDGGNRGNGGDGPKQLTQADLANMTPEQIVAADDAGQLRDLKAGKA